MSLLHKPIDLTRYEKAGVKPEPLTLRALLERLCREIAFDEVNTMTGRPAPKTQIVGKIRRVIDRIDWAEGDRGSPGGTLTAAQIASGDWKADPGVPAKKHFPEEPPGVA